MCVPMIGAVVGAVGSIMAGNAEASMHKYNAKVAKINADAAVREGFYKGGLQRTEGDAVLSKQTAAMGASGADINSGSFEEDKAMQVFRTEQSANIEIWKGRTEQTKFLNDEKASKAAAKSSKMAGFIGAAKSLVGGLSGMSGSFGGGGGGAVGAGPVGIL